MEEVLNDDDFTLLIVGDDNIIKDNILIPNITEVLKKSETMPILLETEVKKEDSIDIEEEKELLIISNRNNKVLDVSQRVPLWLEADIKQENSIDIKKEIDYEDFYENYESLDDSEWHEEVNVKYEESSSDSNDNKIKLMEEKSKNKMRNNKSSTNKKNKIYAEKKSLAPDQILEGQTPISYIQQLCIENPELVKSKVKLIEHLVEMMRATRAPEPPWNFCKIGGDCDFKIYVCSICNAEFKTLAVAARHYQHRHGYDYLSCFACGRTYRLTSSLYKHEKVCTAPYAQLVLKARGKYLGVKGKNRAFTTSNKFKPTTTETPKRFYCSQCTASFSLKHNMLAHELAHSALSGWPARCHRCPAAYTSEVALRRHMKIHEDHVYICDHCGHSSKIRSAFITHMNVHLPLRKYACQYCPRRFAQNQALQHHVNTTHLNLPPAHACPVCPRRYARLTLVKNHMKKFHGLDMITRKMLPSLDKTEVEKAKVVLKSELNQNYFNNKIQEYGDQSQSKLKKNSSISYYKLINDKDKEKVIEVHLPEDDEFLRIINTEVKFGCKVMKVDSKAKIKLTSIESSSKGCVRKDKS